MIKHIEMCRIKDVACGNDRKTNAYLIKEKLLALQGRIPGMIAIEAGVDFSCSGSSCDVALYSQFVDRKALAEYQVHPEHENVKSFIGEVSEERRIVDYEV